MEPTIKETPLPPKQFVLDPEIFMRAAGALTSSPENSVVLTGSAGSGKSALAARLASDLRDRFEGPPIWLSCEGGAGQRVEAPDLARTVLRQLDQEIPSDSTETIAAARKALSKARKLLVVDDVSDEGQVYELLPDYRSGTAMIVVSRHALRRIPIPHVELDSLSMPAAIELLRGTAGNSPELEDVLLCEELVGIAGGLPLSLRLIGAQIADGTSPIQLLRLLRDESTRRSFVDPKAGISSVRSAIAAAYDSLNEQGRALLRLLSLLPSTVFTADDLNKETGFFGSASAVLRGLVQLGLIEEEENGVAYRMHPAVRRFAREQLGGEDLDSLAARFVPSHLENPVLKELRGKASGAPMAGQLSDHVEAQEYALRVARAANDKAGEARALTNLGVLYQDRGHFADAAAALNAALDVAEVVGDTRGVAEVRLNIGKVAHESGRIKEAENHYRKGLRIFETLNDFHGRATASLLLGDLLIETDRPQEAGSLYAMVRDLAPEETDLWVRSTARFAYLAELNNDVERARGLYARGLNATAASDADRAEMHLRLAVLELREGRERKAGDLCEQAFVLYRRAGLLQPAAQCALLRGAVLIMSNETYEAANSFAQGKHLLEDQAPSRLTALIALGDAFLDARGGRLEVARSSLEEALAHFRELDDSLGEAYALLTLASVLEAEGEKSEAATVIQLGEARFEEAGAEVQPLEAALVLMTLTDLTVSGKNYS
jgi:tetratricopeptide (TPR) repeat protein